MSSMMDATPTYLLSPCASCHQERRIACCYCEAELCADCTAGHLALCPYAKIRRFRTWTTPKLEQL